MREYLAGEGADARAIEACPVCRWPDEGALACGVCGWRLIGDYVLGAVTPAAELDLAARLADARRRFDLRAAVRVAGPAEERDPELLARLARLARGGSAAPRADQISRAEAEIDAADTPVAPASAGVGFALTRLVSGQTEAIAFVEVGADAIAVQTLTAGVMGVPALLSVPALVNRDSVPWTDILPRLPADRDRRHLQMAGDIGDSPSGDAADARATALPAPQLALVRQAIEPVLARLLAVGQATVAASRADWSAGESNSMPPRLPHLVDTVLVRRTYRWPVLEAAVAEARAFLRPVAEIVAATRAGDLAGVVSAAASQAPLRYAYDLVLTEVNPGTRVVRIDPVELFAAGSAARPGTGHATTKIRVAPVPGHAANRVALPVVARHTLTVSLRNPRALAEQRPLVTMAALDGAAGPTDLVITLAGPGRVDIAGTPGSLEQVTVPPGWPDLLTGLPVRLPEGQRLAEGGLDLALLIELGGEDRVVDARVRLARAIVEEFRAAPGPVRVAVLGYRDHFGRHHIDAIPIADQEDAALVVGCKLSPVGAADAVLRRSRRWDAVEIHDNHAAPIEDALQMIAGSGWKWDRAARCALLIIGGRPPHPSKAGLDGDRRLPCPYRWSWEESLGRLRAGRPVECFAVLDRPVTLGHAEQAWRRLAAEGLYEAKSVSAGQLAKDVGLPQQAPAIGLCLATRA